MGRGGGSCKLIITPPVFCPSYLRECVWAWGFARVCVFVCVWACLCSCVCGLRMCVPVCIWFCVRVCVCECLFADILQCKYKNSMITHWFGPFCRCVCLCVPVCVFGSLTYFYVWIMCMCVSVYLQTYFNANIKILWLPTDPFCCTVFLCVSVCVLLAIILLCIYITSIVTH